MKRGARRRRAFFGLAAAGILLGGAEFLLRAVGFRYEGSPSYMRFGRPDAETLYRVLQPDADLLWRLRPGSSFGVGAGQLNAQGFRGPDFLEEKRPGVIRIAALGCSVTFGRPEGSYPSFLGDLLSQRLGRPVEVMNFGVPGYSSWQGRKLLPRVLAEYHPDFVIILFGWNDHWRAVGFADKDQVFKPGFSWLREVLGRLRLYQLLNKIQSGIRKRPPSPGAPLLRVSAADYEENLREMVRLCRQSGARPLLATAAGVIRPGRAPRELLRLRLIAEPAELERLHRQYNELVRKVAREENVPLADLDLIFRGRDVTSLFEAPEEDVVHPNLEGLKLMAETFSQVLAADLEEAPGRGSGE